ALVLSSPIRKPTPLRGPRRGRGTLTPRKPDRRQAARRPPVHATTSSSIIPTVRSAKRVSRMDDPSRSSRRRRRTRAMVPTLAPTRLSA
ncbi:hypothetical protein BN1723_020631, partial [Verticillium longisporum]